MMNDSEKFYNVLILDSSSLSTVPGFSFQDSEVSPVSGRNRDIFCGMVVMLRIE